MNFISSRGNRRNQEKKIHSEIHGSITINNFRISSLKKKEKIRRFCDLTRFFGIS